jgi:hypothetical protein
MFIAFVACEVISATECSCTIGLLARKRWNLGLAMCELMSDQILWIKKASKVAAPRVLTLITVSLVGVCLSMVSRSSKQPLWHFLCLSLYIVPEAYSVGEYCSACSAFERADG